MQEGMTLKPQVISVSAKIVIQALNSIYEDWKKKAENEPSVKGIMEETHFTCVEYVRGMLLN